MPPLPNDAGTSTPLTRRNFLARLGVLSAAVAGAGLLTACGGVPLAVTPITRPENSDSPLTEAASAKAMLFGAATGQWCLQSDPQFAAAFAQHAGLLVPENELKWDTVEPQPGVFNFGPGDWLADFAARNGMLFRGHTLVWHNQTPSWVGVNVTSAQAEQQLTNHIAQTVAHYAGRVHSWDVVNEAINPGDGRSDYLRNTVWLNALGPGYIETAFRAAAAADPAALLVYNDYGFEYDTDDAALRRAGILRLLTSLKASGTPLHALGIQAHLEGTTTAGFTRLPGFLQQIADLGLKIFVTELDVCDRSLPADTQTRDTIVADVYQRFLDVVLQQIAVAGVITWGLSDRYTWLSQFAPRSDGRPVRPLPLDGNYQAKPAVWAILNAFNAAVRRGA